MKAACTQKIQQNIQMDGESISSGNSGEGNSLTNGKLKKRTKAKLQSNLLESGTSIVDGEGDGGREIEEQFKRQANSKQMNNYLILLGSGCSGNFEGGCRCRIPNWTQSFIK